MAYFSTTSYAQCCLDEEGAFTLATAHHGINQYLLVVMLARPRQVTPARVAAS